MTERSNILQLYQQPYDFDAMYAWAQNFMDSDISTDNIHSFIDAIQQLATPLKPNIDPSNSIDISGTGGDKVKTINIGTISAFVLAAGGLTVGKQSTKGYTSLLGSRDFLEQLGIEVKREGEDPHRIERLLEKYRLAFYYHPSFNHHFANQLQFFADLKARGQVFVTPWHVLFWLYNPLPLSYRLYGMFSDKYLNQAAQTLQALGIEKAWVVHGQVGLDEISIVGPSTVVECSSSGCSQLEITPSDFGLPEAQLAEIEVHSPQEAYEKGLHVLSGQDNGPLRDLVTINAGTGFYLAGVKSTLTEAAAFAADLLDNKSAYQKYKDYQTDSTHKRRLI